MGRSEEKHWEEPLEKFNCIAKDAIHYYPHLSQSTIQLLDYSENATYLVENPGNGEKYMLRVCRPGYHTKSEIESEMAWVKSIDESSPIEVALPISGTNGEVVQTVRVAGDKNDYHCTLFTFLNGETPDEHNEHELRKQFRNLGEITAHLHDHSQNWKKSHLIDRIHWDYEAILGEKPEWGRWQDGVAITHERLKLFQEVSNTIKTRLERFGKGPDRYGLIHADLRLANLLVENKRMKVIDFDDCGFGWYLFDLATALSFIEHKPYVPELIQSWLEGYRKVRELSEDEEHEIPTFVMMRRLMLISWIGSRDNETAREMGSDYTESTDNLAKKYLDRYKT